MGNKYEFQIKYYENLLKNDISQYFRYINNNKIPYSLDIFHKQIDENIEKIKQEIIKTIDK